MLASARLLVMPSRYQVLFKDLNHLHGVFHILVWFRKQWGQRCSRNSDPASVWYRARAMYGVGMVLYRPLMPPQQRQNVWLNAIG